MSEWKCPNCPKVINEKDAGIRRLAVRNHEKSHDVTEAPSKGKVGRNGRSGGSGGFLDDLFDGIASIFD